MDIIILNSEITVSVSNKMHNKLKSLSNWGGFQRFNISFYDQQQGIKSTPVLIIVNFLKTIFVNANDSEIIKLLKA